jgi:orotidine-5'-phosphate decarboxylase
MVEHFGDRLFKKIRSTKSFLCLGIDPHLNMIPKIFNKERTSTNNIKTVENFCFSLLDTAYELVPAIKPQIALFEQLGPDGMKLLSSLCKHAQSKGF